MSRASRERSTGIAQAITAIAPLFRLFVSIARNASLLSAATGKDREPLFRQLDGELRQVARIFDQLDRSLQSAWRLFAGLLELVEKVNSGQFALIPSRGPKPQITPRRRPRRKERATVDWPAVSRQVRESLERMGGSGTLTGLLEQTSGLSHSRIKRGLAILEKAGVVERSGVRRSTRYHLTSATPDASG